MTGSGKSTASECLVNRGWHHIRFGQVTIDRLKEDRREINPETEKNMREQLRRDHGMGAFALLSLAAIEEGLKHEHVVIDGLYSWSEYKILRETYGNRIHVVAIVASPKTRYERLENRVHDSQNDPNYRMRPLRLGEAQMRDHAEIENIEKGGPIAMADFTVVNESSQQNMIDALFTYVDQVIPS